LEDDTINEHRYWIVMPSPEFLPSLRRALCGGRYDLLFLDLWGCTHDGDVLCPGTAAFISSASVAGVPVLFLGNSPNTKAYAEDSLAEKGLGRSSYLDIVTSGVELFCVLAGEVESDFHAPLRGKKCYHYGKPSAATVLQELAKLGHIALVDRLDEADFAVITKPLSRSDTVETAMPFLEQLLARKLPLICGSADNRAIEGGVEVVCGGAIARKYQAMGGAVYLHGKPSPSLYSLAHMTAEKLLGKEIRKERICMVGDSLETDCAGAAAYGIDSCLLALTGVHTKDFETLVPQPPNWRLGAESDASGKVDGGADGDDEGHSPSDAAKAKLKELCEVFGVTPTYWGRGL
jgi:HAD superfamily hydrolase (TIGR01459 family)